MSYHQTIILGNLGKDPEVRYLPAGDAVANFSVAVSEKWKNKAGEMQESTEWYRCTAFRASAENIGKYFHKGDPILVVGRMKTRKWQNKEGQDQYSTDLQVDKWNFVGSKGGQRQERPDNSQQKASQDFQAESGFDDSIPF